MLAIGAIAALAIIAPWGYWNTIHTAWGQCTLTISACERLRLRSQIGARAEQHDRTDLHSIGWQGWLMMKLRWFAWLFNVNGYFPLSISVDTQTASFWDERSLDFVVVSRTIGVASIGVFAALWRRAVHGDFRDRLALRLVRRRRHGIVIVILLIVQVGITHHHAYGDPSSCIHPGRHVPS